jgi:hypothetical protein
MQGQTSRTEHGAAHTAYFCVGLAQLSPAIRTLLFGGSFFPEAELTYATDGTCKVALMNSETRKADVQPGTLPASSGVGLGPR